MQKRETIMSFSVHPVLLGTTSPINRHV